MPLLHSRPHPILALLALGIPVPFHLWLEHCMTVVLLSRTVLFSWSTITIALSYYCFTDTDCLLWTVWLCGVGQDCFGESRSTAVNESWYGSSWQHLGCWWWQQTRQIPHQQGLCPYLWFVCGWQVLPYDPLVTHVPYLSALEMYHSKPPWNLRLCVLYTNRLLQWR